MIGLKRRAEENGLELPSTQGHLDILKVRDGIVALKDGSFRLVARATPINFSLKNEREQEVIIEVCKALLNSLSYSLNLVVHSKKLEVAHYLHRLESLFKARGETGKELGRSDISLIKELVETRDLLEKRFYLVIPCYEEKDFGEAKRQLALKRDALASYLKRIGVEIEQLGDEELVTLFTELYSGLDWGEKAKDRIAPSETYHDYTYFQVGNKLTRTFFISSYPDEVSAGWLQPLLNFSGNFILSLHVHPASPEVIVGKLQRDLRRLKRTIVSNELQGKETDEFTLASYEDARELMKKLVRGKERIFNLSLYVTLIEETKEALDLSSRRLLSALGGLMLKGYPAILQMEQGFKSSLPVGKDHLFYVHNMDTSSLSTTFPFISSELSDEKGIFYGVNKHSNSLVIVDRFGFENANMVVCAKSGAGKSYAMKLDALRHWLQGVDVIVIDPERDFKRLCQALGGQYIKLSAKSTDCINPCDLSASGEEGELASKALYLQALAELMLGEMDNRARNDFDRAVLEAYRRKDITSDPKTHSLEPPLLSDIEKVLAEREETQELAQGLERFVRGSFSSLFRSHTSVNLRSSFVVIDTRDLEEQLRPVGMFIALGWVWDIIRQDLRKRILICDEVWELLAHEDSARFLFSLAKRARKYWLGLTTITQDVTDFLHSDYGKVLVTNSSTQLLLRQSEAAIDEVAKTFKLSRGERAFLLSCDVGEGLLFAGSNHVAVEIKASPEEHQLITTRPEDLIELEGVI
jgi:hypothetical protein